MINPRLKEALAHPLWKGHKPNDKYTMDNNPGWSIWYYPIFEDGKTGEEYEEPRALVGKPKKFNGEDGIDLREVPLRYLKRIEKCNCGGCANTLVGDGHAI